VSYQHITYYPVMCVARVNLYLQTLLLLFSKRKVPDRAFNILGIFVFWSWFPLLVSCLPNWNERVFFVLASFCVCSVQHIQFTLNHFAANVYVGAPKGDDWFEKQTSGTIDIDCSSWMDWFFWWITIPARTSFVPEAAKVPLEKYFSCGSGAMQETQLALSEFVLL